MNARISPKFRRSRAGGLWRTMAHWLAHSLADYGGLWRTASGLHSLRSILGKSTYQRPRLGVNCSGGFWESEAPK